MEFDVLIIDDSDLDRRLSEMVIKKKMFASHVVTCTSVAEGLTYLHALLPFPEQLPDVIFLDINMPVKDGFDFLDYFLQFPEYVRSRCNVFMISATSSRDDLERIKHYPIVRKFFSKPLTLAILDEIKSTMETQTHE